MRLRIKDYALPAPELAPALLGKLLCRRLDDGRLVKARITETEAYFGEDDSACHAHCGRTARNAIMYERGGFAYVYLCYGMHEMLNVVSGRTGHPEAVLVRGVTDFPGPGRLTKALSIDRSLNGENLATSKRLWLEDDGLRPAFSAGPRIGIGYASPEDQARLWRFTVPKASAMGSGEKFSR